MQPNKVYDEVIEFIASSSPQNVCAFRPSEEAKARVADLIFRERLKVYRRTRNPSSITTYKSNTSCALQRHALTTIWQMARWISAELSQTVADVSTGMERSGMKAAALFLIAMYLKHVPTVGTNHQSVKRELKTVAANSTESRCYLSIELAGVGRPIFVVQKSF